MVGQRGFQKSAPPRGFDGQTGIVTSRREQAERSRALLVSIALDLFVSQGYEATSIAQIQEQANMARRALYHHFPDGKLSLFNAVVDLVDQQLHDGFERIMNDIDSPVEQIVAGFDLVLDLATDPVFARIILIEAAVVMPGASTDGSEFQLLQHNLELAMTNGELRTQARRRHPCHSSRRRCDCVLGTTQRSVELSCHDEFNRSASSWPQRIPSVLTARSVRPGTGVGGHPFTAVGRGHSR